MCSYDRLCPGSPLRSDRRGGERGSCCCGRPRWRRSRGGSRRSARSRGRRRRSGVPRGCGSARRSRAARAGAGRARPERAGGVGGAARRARGDRRRGRVGAGRGGVLRAPTGCAGSTAGTSRDVIARRDGRWRCRRASAAAPTRFAAYAAAGAAAAGGAGATARGRRSRLARGATSSRRCRSRAASRLGRDERAAAICRVAGAARDPQARRAGRAPAPTRSRTASAARAAGAASSPAAATSRCGRARRARRLRERLELPEAASGSSSSGRSSCWSIGCWPRRGGAGGRCGGCGSRRGWPEGGLGLRGGAAEPERRAEGLLLAWRRSWASCRGRRSRWPAGDGFGPAAGDQEPLVATPEERRRARLAEAVRQGAPRPGEEALLRVLEVDPESRVPERRAMLTPFPEPSRLSDRVTEAPGRAASRSRSASGARHAGRGRAAWRSRRCARSGWSRTAGGRRDPLRRRYFELVLADGRDVSSSASRRTAGAGIAQRGLSGDARATSSCTRTPPSRSSTARRRPVELAAAAAELGYPALALTDHDGLWGSMEFAQACRGSASARSRAPS